MRPGFYINYWAYSLNSDEQGNQFLFKVFLNVTYQREILITNPMFQGFFEQFKQLIRFYKKRFDGSLPRGVMSSSGELRHWAKTACVGVQELFQKTLLPFVEKEIEKVMADPFSQSSSLARLANLKQSLEKILFSLFDDSSRANVSRFSEWMRVQMTHRPNSVESIIDSISTFVKKITVVSSRDKSSKSQKFSEVGNVSTLIEEILIYLENMGLYDPTTLEETRSNLRLTIIAACLQHDVISWNPPASKQEAEFIVQEALKGPVYLRIAHANIHKTFRQFFLGEDMLALSRVESSLRFVVLMTYFPQGYQTLVEECPAYQQLLFKVFLVACEREWETHGSTFSKFIRYEPQRFFQNFREFKSSAEESEYHLGPFTLRCLLRAVYLLADQPQFLALREAFYQSILQDLLAREPIDWNFLIEERREASDPVFHQVFETQMGAVTRPRAFLRERLTNLLGVSKDNKEWLVKWFLAQIVHHYRARTSPSPAAGWLDSQYTQDWRDFLQEVESSSLLLPEQRKSFFQDIQSIAHSRPVDRITLQLLQGFFADELDSRKRKADASTFVSPSEPNSSKQGKEVSTPENREVGEEEQGACPSFSS